MINTADRARYSMPFFFGANYATVVRTLPGCTGPDNPARYPPTNCGRWTETMITDAYEYRRAHRGTVPNPKLDAGCNKPFLWLIVDPDDDKVALNFASVDGLLVYDDSLLAGIPATEQRTVLLRTAQPLYVSRWTGVVIRGPVGEDLAR